MSNGRPETREAILAAARQLIEDHGPAAVRMQDIAEKAGISRQGIYLHFKSRNELLLDLVRWIDRSQGLGDRIQSVWNAPDAVTALERFIALNATYTHKIYKVAQSLMSGRYTDEAIAQTWTNRMKGRRDTCRKLIRWLRREHRFTAVMTVKEGTDFLWTLISIQVWEQLIIDSGWSEEQYQEHLLAILKRILISD